MSTNFSKGAPPIKIGRNSFTVERSNFDQPTGAAAAFVIPNVTDADGWIDVSAFARCVVIVTPDTSTLDVGIETKRSPEDPSPATLVATATLAAGTTTEHYKGVLDYVHSLRIIAGAGTAPNTFHMAIFMEGG